MKKIILLLVLSIFISGCIQDGGTPDEGDTDNGVDDNGADSGKPECPYECCEDSVNSTYEPKACSAGYECHDNVCVETPEQGLVDVANVTQLTFLEYLAGDPDWSPDGSQLIFIALSKSQIDGGLCLINSDGTGFAKVASWEFDYFFNPSWSPVDNKVVCHRHENKGLFLIDLDGDPRKGVKLTSRTVEHASWNHDGTKIAYNVYEGSFNENEGYEHSSIWIMNADGSRKIQLTTSEDGFCTSPSFSYDGSKIVYLKGFTSTLPGPKPDKPPNEIWIMNSDSSNKHMIYAPDEGMMLIRERAWNKNNKIIFTRHFQHKVSQIWVINSDGTNPQCLLTPPNQIDVDIYDDAVWDNSGTKIAVTKVILPEEHWQVATFSWEE